MRWVDAMQLLPKKPGVKVVQILGGVGNPAVEAHAMRLTSRMARMVNGDAIYLPVAGILATEAARDVLLADPVTQKAITLFDKVTTALVGIGALDPSPLLAQRWKYLFSSGIGYAQAEKKRSAIYFCISSIRMGTWSISGSRNASFQ